MAIAKLNKNIKNKGEVGYEQSPINKQLLQDMCNKTNEIIDKMPLKETISAGDFNDVIETGLYMMKDNPKNAPKNHQHFYLLVSKYTNNNYILQIAISLFKVDANQIYIRKKDAGTWGTWETLNGRKGIFPLTTGKTGSTVGYEITLSESVNNFDCLIFVTGTVSTGDYIHSLSMPFIGSFEAGKKAHGNWQSDSLFVAQTTDGKIVLEMVSETVLKIKSITGTQALRGVHGVIF